MVLIDHLSIRIDVGAIESDAISVDFPTAARLGRCRILNPADGGAEIVKAVVARSETQAIPIYRAAGLPTMGLLVLTKDVELSATHLHHLGKRLILRMPHRSSLSARIIQPAIRRVFPSLISRKGTIRWT